MQSVNNNNTYVSDDEHEEVIVHQVALTTGHYAKRTPSNTGETRQKTIAMMMAANNKKIKKQPRKNVTTKPQHIIAKIMEKASKQVIAEYEKKEKEQEAEMDNKNRIIEELQEEVEELKKEKIGWIQEIERQKEENKAIMQSLHSLQKAFVRKEALMGNIVKNLEWCRLSFSSFQNDTKNIIDDLNNSNYNKFQAATDHNTCDICYVEPKAITFLPCGHFNTCEACADKQETCPMCRAYIQGRVKTFQ